ncbi:MAG: DUF6134 family protein [Pseudomonadota bacterium]
MAVGALAQADPAAESNEAYRFEVSVGGRALGVHAVDIQRTDHGSQVTSRTNLKYRLAFVTLFRYEHESVELWRDGCLGRLTSQTNDNGKRYAVTTQAGSNPLLLERSNPTGSSERRAEPCPSTFAYWDPKLLDKGTLINAQTGDSEAVVLEDRGIERIDGEALRHRLLKPANGEAIHLWHRESDGRWRRLASETDRGTLLYLALDGD